VAGASPLWQTGAMQTALRLAILALAVVLLDHCASAPLQTCDQIPEKSTGACRVGLPTYWYYDDQWRTE
jgi:hypothetical protein